MRPSGQGGMGAPWRSGRWCASRTDTQEQAACVRELVGAGLGLSRPDRSIRQGHWGYLRRGQGLIPPEVPPIPPGSRRTSATTGGPSVHYIADFSRFFHPLAHLGDQGTGAAYRTRTCDPLITKSCHEFPKTRIGTCLYGKVWLRKPANPKPFPDLPRWLNRLFPKLRALTWETRQM